MDMWTLMPEAIDNDYRGAPIAKWVLRPEPLVLLMLVLALRKRPFLPATSLSLQQPQAKLSCFIRPRMNDLRPQGLRPADVVIAQ